MWLWGTLRGRGVALERWEGRRGEGVAWWEGLRPWGSRRVLGWVWFRGVGRAYCRQ